MGNDANKISRFKQLISSGTDDQYDEAIGTALLIENEEDRSLYLLDAARSLLTRGDWKRAHGVNELMPEGYEKAQLCIEIGDHLASVGQIDRALPVYGDAESASVVEGLLEWQQAELLNQIANSLTKWNARVRADKVRKRAVVIAQKGQQSASVQDSWDATSVLGEIAENLAAVKEFEQASEVADSISNDAKREYISSLIAEYSSSVKRVA